MLRIRYTILQTRIWIPGIVRVVHSALKDQPGRFFNGDCEGLWLVISHKSKTGELKRAFAAVDMTVSGALKMAIPRDLWIDRDLL